MLAPALAGLEGRVEIALIARRPGLDVLRPFIKEGMDYETGGWHRLFMEHPPLIRGLQGMDLAVAFLADHDENARENLKVLMPGASIHVFPPFPRKEKNVHMALYLAQCMEASGCAVNPSQAIEKAIRYPLLGREPLRVPRSERTIVFHPGSGGARKNHPREFWIELLHAFRGILSGKVTPAVLLGPAEESCLPFYRAQLRREETEIFFSPDTQPLLRILRGARLYLGHDSGITHLAAMLGTPTIALFRKANLDQWKPLGPRVRVIEGESGPYLIEEVCEKAREWVFNAKSS